MIRRLVLAVFVAIVAGTAATLGYAAATDTDPQWDTPSSVMVALAAIWLPQTLFALARRPTPPKETVLIRRPSTRKDRP